MSFLINTANALVNGKPQLESMLIAFKNPSIPLEERWEAYTILVEGKVLTNVYNSGDGFIDKLVSVTNSDYTMYDDFSVERYETISFTDMYDRLINMEDWNEDSIPTQVSLDAWRETVLSSGYAAVKHDW